MGELVTIAPGVSAWLQSPAGHGRTNAGVVVDEDGITLIDSLMVPSQVEPFAAAVEGLGPPLRRVVLSSSHIQYVGGTSRFWMAACYSTVTASERLDLPPNVDGYRRLMPDFADEFDDELRTRPTSHTVDQSVQLTPAVQVMTTAGQQSENLVALIPGADILFAGAMCVFGTTPLAFEGDPARWADELDTFANWAQLIVPGSGPIGGEAELRDLQAYLRACVAAAGEVSRIGSGPWDTWPHREFDAINVERAARLATGDDQTPDSMLRLLGLTSSG